MNIVVCVKQVLDIEKINNLILNSPQINKKLNSEDAHALEEALKIKDKYPDTHVSVITLGDSEAREVLQECLALGADEAVLIYGEPLTDTLITAYILSEYIKKFESFDIVFAGNQAIGGDTGQVGPQVAEFLEIPQVTRITKLISIEGQKLIVERVLDNRCQILKVGMPCLLTAIKELNNPRTMSIKGILKAESKRIKEYTVEDLGISLGEIEASIKIINTYKPEIKKRGRVVKAETEEEAVKEVIKELKGNVKIKIF